MNIRSGSTANYAWAVRTSRVSGRYDAIAHAQLDGRLVIEWLGCFASERAAESAIQEALDIMESLLLDP